MEEKRFLKINDLSSYRIAFDLSNNIWRIVKKWDYLAIQTVGRQFINAIDSISANIAEGFGRRFKKDKVKFYYYAFGLLTESIDWLEKAKARDLISNEDYQNIKVELDKLPRELNYLIKFTLERLSK